MLLPTFTNTTTPGHVELIEHMNLTCFKNAQITVTFLRNREALQVYPKACVMYSFSSKDGDKEGLCLSILVLYHPWIGFILVLCHHMVAQ